MDILAELENFKNQYAAANSLFEEATAQANELKAALGAKEEAITSLESAKVEAEEKATNAFNSLNAKQAELDGVLAELNNVRAALAELQANAKTAQETAIEIAASQGIPAPKLDVSASAPAMTRKEALAAYEAISNSRERGQFYAKHRDLLLG